MAGVRADGDAPRDTRAGRALIAGCIAGLCLVAILLMSQSPDVGAFSVFISPVIAAGTAVIVGLLLAAASRRRLVAIPRVDALAATMIAWLIAPFVYWVLWFVFLLLLMSWADDGAFVVVCSVLSVLCGAGTVLGLAAWASRRPSGEGRDHGRRGHLRQSTTTPNALSLPAPNQLSRPVGPNQLSRPVGPTYWTVSDVGPRGDRWRKAVRWFTNGFVLVSLLVVAANFVARDGPPGLVTFLLGLILYALIPMIVVAPIVALWFWARAIRSR
jgi:hypothetical protein